MYKDKDKQREADKARQRRHRAKGVTSKGVTQTQDVTPSVTLGNCKYCGIKLDHPKLVCCGPCAWKRKGYLHKGGRPDFQCRGAVLTGGYKLTPYEQANYKPASELGKGEHNPVSKPGGLQKVETPQAAGRGENDK